MVQGLRLRASTAGSTSSIPGWGTKIPHAVQQGQKKKKRKFISRELFLFNCKVLTIKTFKGYSEIGPKSAAVRKENLESKNRSAITTRAL